MSHALAVAKMEDDQIVLAADLPRGKYYRLGSKITVRVDGKHFLCLTCRVANVNSDCEHIRRTEEYIRDNAA